VAPPLSLSCLVHCTYIHTKGTVVQEVFYRFQGIIKVLYKTNPRGALPRPATRQGEALFRV